MAAAFDTLRYRTRLRSGGFSEQQAVTLGEALADVVGEALMTKQDLRDVEGRMDARFGGVDRRFEAVDRRFELLEYRLTVRLGSMLAVAVGVVAAVVRLF